MTKFNYVLARVILGLALLALPQTSKAARTDIPQIGPHEPILTFEKNENPQNILVVYTQVDKDCHFRSANAKSQEPFVDFYWLMDGKKYKPVNPMIKNGIRDRVVLEKSKAATSDSFTLKIADLADLKTDLKESRVVIQSRHDGAENCQVEALITLGPSDHERALKIKTISTISTKTLIPPFRKIKEVSLEGKDAKTGETLKRTYTRKL